MGRTIDADDLLNRLPDDLPYKASVRRVLMQAPDAVVYCKDCKYKDTWQEAKIRDWFWCGVSGLQVVEDMDFCSYGERKDDAHEPMGA